MYLTPLIQKGYIEQRDTKSYFKEVLEDYAEELEIEDLIDVLKEIGID